METILGSLLIAIGMFGLGFTFGIEGANTSTQKDCRAFQQFRIGEVVFDCKERSK